MIPLRDHSPPTKTPWVTWGLILANVLVFLYGYFWLTPQETENWILTYSFIPAEITRGQDWWAILTSMFMHGGLTHLLGNMLFLHIFGDNLEDALGHFKYLIYYLLSGVAGALLQTWMDPNVGVPNLGASGAIAGLLGGYLVLFPRHQIEVLWGGLGWGTSTVPAFTMLVYWIGFQILYGFGSLGLDGGGVAYFAHIGGFIFGATVALLVKPLIRRVGWNEG
jgi:membrane associated rhomboid family serine protease